MHTGAEATVTSDSLKSNQRGNIQGLCNVLKHSKLFGLVVVTNMWGFSVMEAQKMQIHNTQSQ